jgi:hypothetical protein
MLWSSKAVSHLPKIEDPEGVIAQHAHAYPSRVLACRSYPNGKPEFGIAPHTYRIRHLTEDELEEENKENLHPAKRMRPET